MGGGGWDHWDWEEARKEQSGARYEPKLIDFTSEELEKALKERLRLEEENKKIQVELDKDNRQRKIAALKKEIEELEKA